MIEARVVADRGTHLLLLPKDIPVDTVVDIGPPRNIKAVVIRADMPDTHGEHDGCMLAEVLPEFSPPDNPRRPVALGPFAQEPVKIGEGTVKQESDRIRKALGLPLIPETSRRPPEEDETF